MASSENQYYADNISNVYQKHPHVYDNTITLWIGFTLHWSVKKKFSRHVSYLNSWNSNKIKSNFEMFIFYHNSKHAKVKKLFDIQKLQQYFLRVSFKVVCILFLFFNFIRTSFAESIYIVL